MVGVHLSLFASWDLIVVVVVVGNVAIGDLDFFALYSWIGYE